jgi:polysaccharide export outer membrane protein
MFSQQQAFVKRIFIVTAMMLFAGLAAPAAFAQDNSTPVATDSAPPAQPVLPAPAPDSTNSGKDVARAASLPTTDATPSRVATIRPDSYIVGVGDFLDINVWKEGELSKAVGVRPDGMITLPLIGEIKAVGLTPVQLQDVITAALQKVMSDPVVTVIVTSVNSLSFNIVGSVLKPGYYPLTRPVTILDAIALTGGFRDFAKEKKIYVLRTGPDGKQERIKFNYKEVIKGKNMAQNITLQPHDTLVIP